MKDEASAKLDTLVHKVTELTGLSELARLALVALAGGTVVGAFEALVGQAIEAEDAITKLNAALAVGGNYTAEGSREVQQMAEQMEHLTTTSSTAAIQISATIGAIAKDLTAHQLAQMQRAAIGLAEAHGVSVQRASMMIARSLEGQSNMLRRWGIDLDTSAGAQERANVIIEKTAGLFTIAEAAAGTLGGRLQQVKNEWHEFQQTLGEVIVRAFHLTGHVNALRLFLIHLDETVRANVGTLLHWVDVAKAAFQGVWNVLKVIIDGQAAQFRILWEAIKYAFEQIDEGARNLTGGGVLKAIGVALAWLVALSEAFSVVIAAGFKNGIITLIEFHKAAYHIGELLGDAITFGWYWLKSKSTDFINWLIDRFNDLILLLPSKVRAALGVSTIGHVVNEAAEYLADAKKRILDAANAVHDNVQRIIASSTEAFNTMRNAVDGIVPTVKKLEHAFDGLNAALKKPVQRTTLDAPSNVQNLAKDDNLDQQARGLLRQQQELDAAYKAGAIGVSEYNRQVIRLTESIKELLKNKKLTRQETVELYNALGKLQSVSIGKRLADDLLNVQKITESTNSEVAKMVIGFRDDMTKALTTAFEAHKNFGETLKKEVGKAAAHYAIMSVGRAIMETAEGIAASFFNPPAAAAHFHAAETFMVAAASMGAIAGATGGFSGGGGAQSAAEATTQAVSNQANGVTIIVPPGLTNSQAWVEELIGNIEQAGERRVTVRPSA